jgi:hypothetical protein
VLALTMKKLLRIWPIPSLLMPWPNWFNKEF